MLAISFLIMSYLSVDSFFHRTYQTWLENTLIFVLPTVWGIYAVYLTLRLNRTNYAVHLLIVIFTIHLTFNGLLLGKEWANLQLLPEERFGGRPSDGFLLWHFSSVSDYRPPLPKAMGCFSLDSIVIDSHFKKYFFHFVTSANLFHRWLAIAFAWRLRHQQLDALRQYYSFCFFVALLLGIAFFNCYVLRATLIFEKANAALGRYFSPDIKNEIENADSIFANQEPKDMRVAVMFTDLISFTKTSESMDPKEVLKHCQNIRQSRWTAFLNLAVRSINL